MDIDKQAQPAIAHRPPHASGETPPTCGARWRRRGASGESREHVDLPLDDVNAPGAPASPDPQVAPRDAELWLLAHRTQGAAVRLAFELRTAFVRQMFRRDFVYVSRQLHGLEASRRVQGLARAPLDDALSALQRRADDVQALFRRIAVELDDAIATGGPASACVAFARPARFQATIVSPAAHRYLALLTQADATLARLELAWLLGLVDTPGRAGLISDCRRALHGFKELACQRRQAVGELVRATNALRRETGGELAGRDGNGGCDEE